MKPAFKKKKRNTCTLTTTTVWYTILIHTKGSTVLHTIAFTPLVQISTEQKKTNNITALLGK